jgi:uncharacterized protein (DUF4213/DUF364 family)
MSILDDLVLNLPESDIPVRSVLIGAHWTAVCSRTCGLASTLIEQHVHGHEMVRDAGCLHKKSARELAEYALSDNQLEASIGVAAINSLLNVEKDIAIEMNAFEVLAKEGRGQNVALVGHFPFIPRLRPQVGQLWVIEQFPVSDEYPREAATALIPQAAVVAMTGSSLINHTLDGLLELCRPDATVVVLGPSTPLSPVLFHHGATILSGACVLDEEAALRTIGQGATFQQVEGVKLVSLRKEK